jgi:hypothetical protein
MPRRLLSKPANALAVFGHYAKLLTKHKNTKKAVFKAEVFFYEVHEMFTEILSPFSKPKAKLELTRR